MIDKTIPLTKFNELYADIQSPTATVLELLENPSQLAAAKSEYAQRGFTTLEDILPASPWSDLAKALLPYLLRMSEQVTMAHVPLSNTHLSDGACLRRLDPPRVQSPDARDTMTMLFDKLGITSLGEILGTRLTPLVQAIAGPVFYRRCFIYLYEEGDYISVHNDHQVGDRVDAQFPVSLGASGGIRVLSDGLMRMHYDCPGSMNILGPRTWHDVPPVLRQNADEPAHRFNFGLRFTPD